MIRIQIIQSFRKLVRDRLYTLVNVTGLTIAMTTAILISLWVYDETHFDHFHAKGDRTYRVLTDWQFGGNEETMAFSPAPLATHALEEIPEVERMVRIWSPWNVVLHYGDEKIRVGKTLLADTAFLRVFDFELLNGNTATALQDPNGAVISEDLALRIFGSVDVLGQPLQLSDKMPLTVTGVLKNVPSNSHLQFELLVPFDHNIDNFVGEGSLTWTAFNYNTYVLLRPGIAPDQVGDKLTELMPLEEGKTRKTFFHLQPLPDIHLGSGHLSFSDAPRGNLSNIRLVGLIGLIILLIACINYINMTTARQAHMARDTGIRKIIGARRATLIRQYLLEAFILVTFSAVLAILLLEICLPYFEQLSDKHFTPEQLFSRTPAIIVLGIILFTVIIAGVQPAFRLSSFKPLEALKTNHWRGPQGAGLRKILVVSQFTCAAALIICVFIILQQLAFVKAHELGYQKEYIFSFNTVDSDPKQLIPLLEKEASIAGVTASSSSIIDVGNRYAGFEYEGKEPEADPFLYVLGVHPNFPQFFGLELTDGRWFLPREMDTTSVIINEKAVAALGLEDPLGKWIEFRNKTTITGIARDFHFRSLHHPIEQLAISQSRYLNEVYIKTTPGNTAKAIAAAENIFAQHEEHAVFDYQFMDESYDQLYKSETRVGQLFLIFSCLAIFISCLGIFGLATFSAERRRKEISIRKVLGASFSNLIYIFSRDFIKLVCIALLLGSPVAWFAMTEWLQDFSYHIAISPWVFLGAGILIISIAFVTISLQSMRTALQNPARSLHTD